MDPPSDQDVKAALARFRARAEARLGPCQLILFGSRARGDHLLTSDADVVVVSPAFAGQRDDDRMVAMLALWDGPVSLQPFCFTPEEFEARRAGINVIAVAAREGRVLT